MANRERKCRCKTHHFPTAIVRLCAAGNYNLKADRKINKNMQTNEPSIQPSPEPTAATPTSLAPEPIEAVPLTKPEAPPTVTMEPPLALPVVAVPPSAPPAPQKDAIRIDRS